MFHPTIIKAAIIGASGYTGAELVRLLYQHPKAEIVAMTAESNAGKPITEIYPHFRQAALPELIHLDDIDFNTDFSEIDVVFCCLPHATTQEVIKKLPETLRVIDLSADFRIRDVDAYEEWYGKPHEAPELQKKAVYGLSEIYADEIRKAKLVACPGCYPTSILLPLIPLLKESMIQQTPIIADSKSGITGAGRSGKVANLYAEVAESVRPYSIGGHRHVAEIEQELSLAANAALKISFTPQVVPMSRGILSCLYVGLEAGSSVETLRETLENAYRNAPFVTILPEGETPATRQVTGTNHALISVHADRLEGRAIILSCIDNLVKGASGQAVQNMNLMFGLKETTGLEGLSVFP